MYTKHIKEDRHLLHYQYQNCEGVFYREQKSRLKNWSIYEPKDKANPTMSWSSQITWEGKILAYLLMYW